VYRAATFRAPCGVRHAPAARHVFPLLALSWCAAAPRAPGRRLRGRRPADRGPVGAAIAGAGPSRAQARRRPEEHHQGPGQTDQGAEGAAVREGSVSEIARGFGAVNLYVRRLAGAGRTGARAGRTMENVCQEQNLLHVVRAWGLRALPPNKLRVRPCDRFAVGLCGLCLGAHTEPTQSPYNAHTEPIQIPHPAQRFCLQVEPPVPSAPSAATVVPLSPSDSCGVCSNFIAFNRGCPFRYLSEESLSAAKANSGGRVDYVMGHVLSSSPARPRPAACCA
jgi:hypothetical protein